MTTIEIPPTPQGPRPITRLTNPLVREISEACREALAPVAARYGLALARNKRRHSYERDSMPINLSMSVVVTDESGAVVPPAKIEWDKWALALGFQLSDFGRSFKSGTRTFTIAGCNPRGKRYTVLGRSPQGAMYKFSEADVTRGLAR